MDTSARIASDSQVPPHGGMAKVGLGYRRRIAHLIRENLHRLDCLEVTTEHFLPVSRSHETELRDLVQAVPVVLHGLALSIGSVVRPPQSYLDNIARLLSIVEGTYYSDHLTMSHDEHDDLGHFLPLWYTEESLEITATNVDAVQRFLGVPLVLETITVPFEMPLNTMSAAHFFHRLVAETGCGVLLDITNLYVNAANGINDLAHEMSELPAEAIRHMHLVGYEIDHDGWHVDSHGAAIQDEIWDLFRTSLQRARPETIILERDRNFEATSSLFDEIAKARQIAFDALGG